jgi:hypothetical protein
MVKSCDCKTSGKLRVQKQEILKTSTQCSKMRCITLVFLKDFRSLQSGKNDIVASCGVLNPDYNNTILILKGIKRIQSKNVMTTGFNNTILILKVSDFMKSFSYNDLFQ